MKLPNPFSQKQSKPELKNKLFLALLLSDSVVQSALWKVMDDNVVVSHRSQIHSYKAEDEEDRLQKIDLSLQDLGPDSQKTDDVVFGLDPNWAETERIDSSKKKCLKDIKKRLGLNPIGYVITNEALYKYLLQENKMLSAVILYIGEAFVNLSLVRQGRLTYSQSVGRSEELISDLKEAIARFLQNAPGSTQFPPNVVLASAVISFEELQNYQQKLIEQNWAEDFNFVQNPVFKLFTPEKIIDAIVTEGGKAVMQTQPKEENKERVVSVDGVKEQTEVKKEEQAQATTFGIPVKQKFVKSELAVDENTKQTAVKESGPTRKRLSSRNRFGVKIKRVMIGGILAGLIALVGFGYLFINRSYSVLVSIKPQTKIVSEEAEVILDPGVSESDADELILKAEEVAKIVQSTDKKVTTGVKLVGEKAKGKVTVFNKTTEEKTFEKGAVFKTGELEFAIEEDLVVPAADTEENEGGDSETKVYGKIEVELLAVEIGADGNIKEDAEFKISDFSDETYSAKAIEDFSGGSSREIRVVAEQDQTGLFNDLKQSLINQAKDDLEKELGKGQYVVATDQYKIIKQEYSAEVGEEIEEIELDLSLELKGLSYTVEDIKPIAEELLTKKVTEGYQLVEGNPEILSQPAEKDEESGQYKIVLNLSSQTVAQIDAGKWQEKLKNLELGQAKAKLNEQENIDQAQLLFRPGIAKTFFKNLPAKTERIEVKINQ
ncbi:MAG: hypothetical protein U9O78_04730 [Patescibacteria group bacterium]|nr:hypothetical protein [Patescibacteria group bacterium]